MSVRPDPDAERRTNPARVGEAAGEAAAQGGASREITRAETREAANAASNFRLPEDQLDAIADRTIDRLEQRGAFEQHAPDQSREAPEAETPAHEREAAAASGEGPPPRKYKAAEKFMGRHKEAR